MNADASAISLRGVTKRFGHFTAVDSVTVDVRAGEFFALLGPSGCGKTTLLRMIAGFEVESEGQIFIDSRDVAGTEPNERPVNMVFQSYAVFPHMTVAQNVGYGLRVTGVPRRETARRVAEALALVKLEGFEDRKPDQLSGGQRQRVALARALIKRPKVLLLDEPLSALDAKLREAMRLELVRLQRSVGITFVIVTHDQNEALSMADRIAVMENGRVRQIAPGRDLYENPSCRFVADFIGKVNLLDGRVVGVEGDTVLIEIARLGVIPVLQTANPASGAVALAIRPEKIRLSAEEPSGNNPKVRGTVREVAYYGGQSQVYLEGPGGITIASTLQNTRRGTQGARVGEALWASWALEDALVLTD